MYKRNLRFVIMKAKVKETGMMVDVHQYGFPDTDLWKCDDENMVFHKSALIFMCDMIDWEERRFQAVQKFVAAILSNPDRAGDNEEICKYSISMADELIKQLKAK